MKKEDFLVFQRKWRKENNNQSTKRYEKTKKGFLMRMYRNMTSRVKGIQKLKSHLYKDKSILLKQDFYDWANQSKDFSELFDRWEISLYQRKLTPTVDRIDSSVGYEIPNMEWVTHSENSRRGATGTQ